MTQPSVIVFSALCVFAGAASAEYRDGQLDESFGVGGVISEDLLERDFGYGVVATPDGTIVMLGTTDDLGNPNGRDARSLIYDIDGNQLGVNAHPHGNFGCSSQPDAFYAATLEPGGTILAGGFAQFACGNGSIRDFYMIRMDAFGNELLRFDQPVFNGVQENIWAIDVQPDGKVIAAGFADTNPSDPSTRDVAVARYNTDGTLDKSFGTDGEVMVDVAGDHDWSYGVAVDYAGRILVNGFTFTNGQRDILLLRLDDTGALDNTFGNNGIIVRDFDGVSDSSNDVVVQRNGKAIVAGNQGTQAGGAILTVLKYNEDGTPDDTFGTDGVATVDFGSTRASANRVVIQKDCKLVVAGFAQVDNGDESTDMLAAARLNGDGSLDTTFNGTGTVVIDVNKQLDDYTADAAVQPNGDIVISGHSRDDSGKNDLWDMALTRITNDNVLFSSPFEYCP